jgi:hypothetical protein
MISRPSAAPVSGSILSPHFFKKVKSMSKCRPMPGA